VAPKTIAIVGPTAVGKTDLSLDVAQRLDAEVVNADSMQLYRGMDIGTAKVPVAQRRGIAHHMLDVLNIAQEASVAMYQQQAREVIAQIHQRGRVAVVVGGSGLFVQGLLDDLQFPGSDSTLRERLQREADEFGAQYMYQRLVQVAPDAAQHVLSTNVRRVIRALEVFELTGKAPKTSLQQLDEVIPSVRIGLTRSREDLDNRIAVRVQDMWQQGFVEEVAGLDALGLRSAKTASKALGYQQILSAFAGHISMDQARADTVTGTRRFVRRQESWFRRDSRIQWLDANTATVADVLDVVGNLD
jgi:tRNA dimethylallyltransferase